MEVIEDIDTRCIVEAAIHDRLTVFKGQLSKIESEVLSNISNKVEVIIDKQLFKTVSGAFRAGYQQCLVDYDKINPKISQQAAIKALGNSTAKLRVCERESILKPTRMGGGAPNGQIGYDRIEVEAANIVTP